MIFLIYIVDSEHQVIVYENIPDLIQRVEWQDIFEGKSIIIDKNGIEYEWDSTQKNEIGTVHDYTIIPTSRVSELITRCLERIKLDENICEFSF
jgi:hemin uptake protein HemP